MPASCSKAKLVSASAKSNTPSRQKQLAVLALAVAMATPVTAIQQVFAQSAERAPELPIFAFEQEQLSNDELLKQGREQLAKDLYEEAAATLQQVKTAELSEGDRKAHGEALGQAQSAAEQRRAARAQFELGQEALDSNRPVEAIGHYKAAAGNRYADEGTRRKAN